MSWRPAVSCGRLGGGRGVGGCGWLGWCGVLADGQERRPGGQPCPADGGVLADGQGGVLCMAGVLAAGRVLADGWEAVGVLGAVGGWGGAVSCGWSGAASWRTAVCCGWRCPADGRGGVPRDSQSGSERIRGGWQRGGARRCPVAGWEPVGTVRRVGEGGGAWEGAVFWRTAVSQPAVGSRRWCGVLADRQGWAGWFDASAGWGRRPVGDRRGDRPQTWAAHPSGPAGPGMA